MIRKQKTTGEHGQSLRPATFVGSAKPGLQDSLAISRSMPFSESSSLRMSSNKSVFQFAHTPERRHVKGQMGLGRQQRRTTFRDKCSFDPSYANNSTDSLVYPLYGLSRDLSTSTVFMHSKCHATDLASNPTSLYPRERLKQPLRLWFSS